MGIPLRNIYTLFTANLNLKGVYLLIDDFFSFNLD